MTEDNNQILISWLSEYAYCRRRFYLKVFERQDAVNEYIAEGSVQHESVHSHHIEKRGSLIKVTGLRVFSKKLNLYGICDNVEFTLSDDGAMIPFLGYKCIAVPIEYKHGKTRNESEYNLQLTAQAMCLEEMFGISINSGFVYYTSSRQRFPVVFDEKVRRDVKDYTMAIEKDFASMEPIVPEYKKRCPKCSVYDICQPKKAMVTEYMTKLRERIAK